MRALSTVGLLVVSNFFMTVAWYGNLYLKDRAWLKDDRLWKIILLSWGLAFAEYCFMIPANRLGSSELGGPFSIYQLKVLQEVITLVVFTLMVIFMFKGERPGWNHAAAFCLLIAAVWLIFRK